MRRKLLQYLYGFVLLTGVVLCFVRPGLSSQNKLIYRIQLSDDTINPITSEYILKSIARAEEDGAQALILALDTPGGLLNSTRSIVKGILDSDVPVIVYIAPDGSRAGSAGVFITYASHVAAMAPSTNMGAAHPVQLGEGKKRDRGGNFWEELFKTIEEKKELQGSEAKKDGSDEADEPDPMESKILNDTLAFIRSLATMRGRNVEWAQKSVSESESITAEEALKMGVVDIIAADMSELLLKLDGRAVKVKERTVVLDTKNAYVQSVDMDARQKFFNILADPNLAYILMILGFYGLLYEITHPGFGVPGVLGTVFLILAYFSMQTLPTNFAGLALMAVGLGLFVAEVFVPGFGVPTLGGIVCLVLGSLLLFDSPVPFMRVSLSLILAFSLTTAAITVFLVTIAIRARKRKIVTGESGLVGEEGTAKADFNQHKGGKVYLHGEIWNAVSDDTISSGDSIKVVEVKGLLVKVKKV